MSEDSQRQRNAQVRAEENLAKRAGVYHGAGAAISAIGALLAPWSHWVGGATVVLGAIVQLVTAAAKGKVTRVAEEDAARAEAEAMEAWEFQLTPVAHTLAQLVATPSVRRSDPYSGLCQQIVAAASGLPKADGVRASIYKVATRHNSRAFVPHPSLFQGRADHPRTEFVEDEDEGREVWRAARAGEVVFCEDTSTQPPPGFNTATQRAYRTFITAPVLYNAKPVGLLTTNARAPGDLTRQDERTMRILAELLATAYGIAGDRWPDVGAR